MGRRLTPNELLRLWYRAPGDDHQRVLWFGNVIADHLLDELQPPERVSISELSLPPATYRALRRSGFEWIDQVEKMSIRELKRIRLVGLQRAVQIRQRIELWRGGR